MLQAAALLHGHFLDGAVLMVLLGNHRDGTGPVRLRSVLRISIRAPLFQTRASPPEFSAGPASSALLSAAAMQDKVSLLPVVQQADGNRHLPRK